MDVDRIRIHFVNCILNKDGIYEDAVMWDEFETEDQSELESVKSFDRMLHRTLREIFRERSSLSSCQIKELLRATDDNPILELILQKEPSLSQVFPQDRGIPLLLISVLGYFYNSAELLVRLGADVNEIWKRPTSDSVSMDTSILHLLIKMSPSSRNERLISLVINYGADLRTRDLDGETLLICAVRQARVQVARWLLEKGATIDINAVDKKYNETALIAATVTSKASELIPMLIEHGADVTVIDKSGMNTLHCLSYASGKQVELAKLLIEKGASVVQSSKILGQPIHQAAFNGRNDLLKLFLEHGADVNAQGNGLKGRTALHVACQKSNVEIIQTLLSVGADMFVEDSDGKKPLALVNHSNVEGVELILKTLAMKGTTYLIPQIKLEHERQIEENFPNSLNYYMDCIAFIKRMKFTRFIPTCTFFDLLSKCQCEVSELMRNRDFERKFWLYDILVAFPVFAEDLVEAFDRAEHYYNSTLQQENVINDAIQNVLPQKVVSKVARYTLNCEICELKKTVSASRRSVQ